MNYLLPAVRGQIENEHGEEGDGHTGDYKVHSVEQCLSPHLNLNTQSPHTSDHVSSKREG